jgi:hypothetical protein
MGRGSCQVGEEQLPIVKALVTAQPDALLKELCERFAGQTGVGVELTKSGSHPPDSSAKPDVNR